MPINQNTRREELLRFFTDGQGRTTAEVGLALQSKTRKLLCTGVGPTQFEVLGLASAGFLQHRLRQTAQGTVSEYVLAQKGRDWLRGRTGDLVLSSPPGDEPVQVSLNLPAPAGT